ncbi:hypothetical protein [Litorimonas cladophorae]|uniref:hypothetical protein n=1 Tax=Litorimonas cladophorae TaxID=1220491 RepID=UPI001F2E1BDF|nr:hypothetical protein [Litorimonas cladophorae]
MSSGLCLSVEAFAGAWNQRAGEGQVISTSSWSQAGQIYTDDFDAVPLQGFSKTETRLYLEQGVTDWLTLVGNGGFQTLSFRDVDSRFDFEGLDDLELGFQVKTYAREGLATSIRLSYIFDDAIDNLAVDVIGGGDQLELRALIGQSRETLIGDFFYDAQFALRSESLDRLDGIQSALTLGFKPTERWLAMVQTYGNHANDQTVDGFIAPEQFQLSINLSLARQYKPGRYIQIGTGQTVLGRNIVKEKSLFIGIWTDY